MCIISCYLGSFLIIMNFTIRMSVCVFYIYEVLSSNCINKAWVSSTLTSRFSHLLNICLHCFSTLSYLSILLCVCSYRYRIYFVTRLQSDACDHYQASISHLNGDRMWDWHKIHKDWWSRSFSFMTISNAELSQQLLGMFHHPEYDKHYLWKLKFDASIKILGKYFLKKACYKDNI